jgi:hypothetical protein
MGNELPTRMCNGCGQVWSSGAFLDPTAQADCGFCGEALVHRRRLPDGLVVELEHLTASPAVAAANGVGVAAA